LKYKTTKGDKLGY